MWISRDHFNLIRERAAEFRAWHEDTLRQKDAIIQHQEARLAALEQERRELTDKILAIQAPQTLYYSAVPPTAPASELPSSDWMSILEKQVKDLEKPEKTDAES